MIKISKTKVAIVLHGLGANGIDSLFANLSYAWDYENFDITYLLAVDEGAKQFWEDEVKANGINVIHLHDLDKKRLLKWPHSLKKALKEYGPFDAVHVNMDMLNGINLFVSKQCKIPVRICHAHTSSNKNSSNKLKRMYVSFMKDAIKKYSTKNIGCSDAAGNYFFNGEDYIVLYNGIDISKYSKDKNEKNDSDFFRFVTVGRIAEPKNPLFLIEIFSEIVKIKPNATLKWVGTGNMIEAVKAKAAELGIEENVEFLGVRNDVYNILKDSDYFLLPSLYEGLSLALAEAQAADLDCFVSDTVSKMSDCGKCMFIPLKDSAKQWAEKICSYIDSERTMKIDSNALSKFDINQMAKTLETFYKGQA